MPIGTSEPAADLPCHLGTRALAAADDPHSLSDKPPSTRFARTLPFGSVNSEAGVDDEGERYIWLEPNMLDRLRSLRGTGESYNDVILRLAGSGEPRQGQNPIA